MKTVVLKNIHVWTERFTHAIMALAVMMGLSSIFIPITPEINDFMLHNLTPILGFLFILSGMLTVALALRIDSEERGRAELNSETIKQTVYPFWLSFLASALTGFLFVSIILLMYLSPILAFAAILINVVFFLVLEWLSKKYGKSIFIEYKDGVRTDTEE